MIRRHGEGGHVVNTASISGFFIRRGRNQGAYSMTKYAVVALSEALEQEVEDAGIGVSVLCPGAVDTHIFESSATRPDRFGGPYARPQQEVVRWARAWRRRWSGSACCRRSGSGNSTCSRIPANARR
jgi:NAD(P)-dependent dehydrogenase (short-subunit alcohol dehydrogenase family)